MQVSNVWSRDEAEQEIKRVLEAAKAGVAQRLEDKDGTFDVTFRRAGSRRRASAILAKGGPIED